MKPEQVIEWADKSGYLNLPVSMRGMELAELTRFAEIVAQHERGENAKLCESEPERQRGDGVWVCDQKACAEAIRARGQKGDAV
jgi:hypothetical protein